MRGGLRLALVCAMFVAAILTAGCGSSDNPPVESLNKNSSAKPSGANALAARSALKGAGAGSSSNGTPSSGSIKISGKSALKSCLEIAARLDSASRAAAKQNCNQTFGKKSDVTTSIDNAMAQARSQCRQAAKNIPDDQARSNALATCAKIK